MNLISLGLKITDIFPRKINKLAVLTYHRVSEIDCIDNSGALSEVKFEEQLLWLKKYFVILDIEYALKLMATHSLPKRAIVITVDDGYIDSFTRIFPLLIKHNLTGSFFIATSGIKAGYLWDEWIYSALMNVPVQTTSISFAGEELSLATHNNKLKAIKIVIKIIKYSSLQNREYLINDLQEQTGKVIIKHQFLTPNNLQDMQEAGMYIGAHTHNHPILSLEDADTAKQEMLSSKNILEGILNNSVDYIAYPNGKSEYDFNELHQQQAKDIGFKAAFSTDWGCNNNENLFALKRMTAWDLNEVKFVIRLALSYFR